MGESVNIFQSHIISYSYLENELAVADAESVARDGC